MHIIVVGGAITKYCHDQEIQENEIWKALNFGN